jgi:hypothetical protein
MSGVTIATALGGNVDSTIASYQAPQNVAGPYGVVVITSAIGATPTVTVNIQGSGDLGTWFNIPYALVATPTTFVTTALTITTAVTTAYLLQAPTQPDKIYRYVKLVLSANVNVTLTASVFLP